MNQVYYPLPTLVLLYLGEVEEGEIILPRGNLILSKSLIKISLDLIVGTDQVCIQFWVHITAEYNKICGIVNNQKNDEQEIGVTKYVDHSLDSLKSRWTQKILPTVNKVQGICETNPPTSGELNDDATMNKYYGGMRELYAKSAKANTE